MIQWPIDAYGLTLLNVVVEIFESTLLDDRALEAVDNVHSLAAAGFGIDLDDLGTVHAAIANLRKFCADRSLVQGIDHDAELQIITSSILALCRVLWIEVLCKGVQTEAERAFWDSAGCDGVQGFLFVPPLPLDAQLPWLRDREVSGRDAVG